MEELQKAINEIQSKIRMLRRQLTEYGLNFNSYLEEMIECLAFIDGYTERALEEDYD